MSPMLNIRRLLVWSLCLLPLLAHAQQREPDVILDMTSQVGTRTRLAAADFKAGTPDPATESLRRTFDTVLAADLANSGIFDMVSKSMVPRTSPGAPGEINLPQWSAAPSSAAFVAFGALGVTGSHLAVNGYLFDTNNPQFPQVLAKQYGEDASEQSAREVAHRFADEIILRLGGGLNGIAETKIYYTKTGSGGKEIWAMDYDGANQHPVTHLGLIALSPRVSPDNTRLAFSTLGSDGNQIKMYSLLLGRLVNFPTGTGTNISPAWSSDGKTIAFSSSRSGDPEIYLSDASGNTARRITQFRGPDVSPTFNPRTGSQIAWISGRTGLPQLYIMDTDGSAVTRLTDSGYVSAPSWSPNGQFVAFGWNRKYGPGAPGGQDIYIMEIASKRFIQLTHGIGPCDFPSWSPDGRHIVFANSPSGHDGSTRIMSMLVNGSERRALTDAGTSMPNWSWK